MPKHALQKLFESVDVQCRSYSGRGMFGKNCLGVDIDRHSSLGEVFASVLEAIANRDCALNELGLEQAAEALRGMSQDQMGLGIIYYFPRVPFVSEDDDEETTLRDRQILSLSREKCVSLLESVGIQCYESEDTATLREAVRTNVEDGTIEAGALEEAAA